VFDRHNCTNLLYEIFSTNRYLISSSVVNIAYTDAFLCGWIRSYLMTVNTEIWNIGYQKFLDDWNLKAVSELSNRQAKRKSVAASYFQGWTDGFHKGWGTSNLTRSVLFQFWNEHGMLDMEKHGQTETVVHPNGCLETSGGGFSLS